MWRLCHLARVQRASGQLPGAKQLTGCRTESATRVHLCNLKTEQYQRYCRRRGCWTNSYSPQEGKIQEKSKNTADSLLSLTSLKELEHWKNVSVSFFLSTMLFLTLLTFITWTITVDIIQNILFWVPSKKRGKDNSLICHILGFWQAKLACRSACHGVRGQEMKEQRRVKSKNVVSFDLVLPTRAPRLSASGHVSHWQFSLELGTVRMKKL